MSTFISIPRGIVDMPLHIYPLLTRTQTTCYGLQYLCAYWIDLSMRHKTTEHFFEHKILVLDLPVTPQNPTPLVMN